jgi:hypothetical protein
MNSPKFSMCAIGDCLNQSYPSQIAEHNLSLL